MSIDLHTAMAAQIFSKNAKDVTPAERKVGKCRNFAELYGTRSRDIKLSAPTPLEVAASRLKHSTRRSAP